MVYEVNGYLPQQGDLVWINFDPSIGKEIKKRRPALVLSTKQYNGTTGMIAICPVTSTKRFGFIEINEDQNVKGYINPLQLYTFDFINKLRNVEYIEPLNDEDMAAVVQTVENIFKFWKLKDSANGET